MIEQPIRAREKHYPLFQYILKPSNQSKYYTPKFYGLLRARLYAIFHWFCKNELVVHITILKWSHPIFILLPHESSRETHRDTPYDVLCNSGRLRTKWVPLLSCRFVEVQGFYKLRCMKRYEINVTFQSASEGLTDTFYGCKKVEETFWFCYSFLFNRQCPYSS